MCSLHTSPYFCLYIGFIVLSSCKPATDFSTNPIYSTDATYQKHNLTKPQIISFNLTNKHRPRSQKVDARHHKGGAPTGKPSSGHIFGGRLLSASQIPIWDRTNLYQFDKRPHRHKELIPETNFVGDRKNAHQKSVISREVVRWLQFDGRFGAGETGVSFRGWS